MRRIILLSLMFILTFGQLAAAQNTSYDFNLKGLDGNKTLADYAGKYVLISFGYTTCPDVCPTTLYEEGQVLKTIKNADQLQVIFVSIDPKSDKLQLLNDYVTYFDPKIAGLTADYPTLKDMADRYGASFGYRVGDDSVYPPNLPDVYTVYHSTLVYLLNPEGEMVDVFDYQVGSSEMIRRVENDIEKGSAYKPAAVADDNEVAAVADSSCPLPKGFKAFKNDALTLSSITKRATDKATLLNFWAVWCGPCRKELPVLDELKQSQNELAVTTMNLGDTADAIEKQFSELNIKSLPKDSTNEDLLHEFKGVGLPFSVLYKDGKPVATKNGIIQETADIKEWAACATSE